MCTAWERSWEGELMMPDKQWRRLREEQRDCCPECPERKRIFGAAPGDEETCGI